MPVVRSRRIGVHHVAFFRSFFEGSLDIREMAQRYLETGGDLSAARQTLKFIQDAFIAAALKLRKDDQAQWLVIPPHAYRGKKNEEDIRGELASIAGAESSSSHDASNGLPNFEQWAKAYDPNGVLEEGELIRDYEEIHKEEIREFRAKKARAPVLPAEKAIGAIDLAKRIQLINELALEIVSSPKLEDPVEGWFSPAVAARLISANIFTLDDIIRSANVHGFRWYTRVPKLGVQTAQRITLWLSDGELAGQLKPTALTQIRQVPKGSLVVRGSREGIATLETMKVPHPLSGIDGTNRAALERNKMDARNDYDAINEWLSVHSGHTFHAYRKEAERLLLWALRIKCKPLSSLTTADMHEFFLFLQEPPADWCSEKRYERYHEHWRPFVARPERAPGEPLLSARSVGQAKAVTSRLFQYLTEQNYLDSNPIKGLVKNKFVNPIKIDHSFTKSQWRYVVEYLRDNDDGTVAYARERFLIVFAYGTGLRLHELAKARMGDLEQQAFEDSELHDVYMLKVVGKGNRHRKVPVPRIALEALREYLHRRGHSRVFHDNKPHTPLIAQLSNT